MDFVVRLMVTPLINKYIASQIDWEVERNNIILYTAYGTVQALILLTYLYIYTKVAKADKRRKDVRIEKKMGGATMQNLMNMAQYNFSKYIISIFFLLLI